MTDNSKYETKNSAGASFFFLVLLILFVFCFLDHEYRNKTQKLAERIEQLEREIQ